MGGSTDGAFHSGVKLLCSCSYDVPEPSEEEKVELDKKRTDKSKFVQELLLSTLAYLDSSSSNSEDSDLEHT